MAVFMLNVCKFNDCGLIFKNLGRLIQHIEENHIDYDPQVVEQKERQQPPCVPLSYVLRFFTDAARREIMKPLHNRADTCNNSSSERIKNSSPTEIDDDFTSEPEDSNDSWTTTEDISNDFTLKYPKNNRNINEKIIHKKFPCPVPGCKKSYKNVNGIKYHTKNGHKNDGKMQRGFKCPCGKYYKTIYGLKNHASVHHGNSVSETLKFLETEMEIDGINHHHHHNHYHQEIKLNDEIKNNSAIMEDHVYVKQNRSHERDSETLGIITPASTPPLSTATITQQNAGKIETILYDRQVRYFAEANSDHSYNN
ncbi:juxtaposed with another zinc finger protein 1 isoform X2 [Leptopilina boulardi]|nr:juxtaposed with another zinc finger protein 1 isoform X2 [Leptopilina boulardi]